ncbi:sensor histidine kinase [Pseudomarimonas arenosa]|uniref:histidine kinase n=1 Tax=Pseudomarimonas arenosa TaxID=2774145 RepID=A0AAW3ZDP0_9GAMM|nr:sensor histidine kinase [Pseudomarimonas arenosa]MBD8524313.1 hypothetical protein [Pseudomarimonas arenosa]
MHVPDFCRGYVWVSVLLLALLCAPASAAIPPAFVRIDDQGAIPDQVLTALAQGRGGFIWIGTAGGLVRYDGYRFQRFSHRPDDPHSMPGNLVRSILVAGDGRIWIGTDVDGLAALDPLSGKFTRFRHQPDRSDSLVNGALFALAESAEGGLWVGSVDGGLSYQPPGATHFEQHAPTLPNGRLLRINVLLVDAQGTLWIGTPTGLFRKPPGAAVQALPGQDELSRQLADSTVYSLLLAADGSLWVGTREGHLFRLQEPHSAEPRLERLPVESGVSGVTQSAYALAQVGDRIWVGLQDGIDIRDADGVVVEHIEHRPAESSSPAGSDLRALLVDRAGLVWAGGFGSGLQWHDPGARAIGVLRDTQSEAGAQQNNVTAILQRRNGELWLGTRGVGVRVLDSALRPLRQLTPGSSELPALELAWVTALAEGPDGSVWLGSREGLWRLSADGKQLVNVVATDRPAGLSVRRLLAQEDGQLWVGARNTLLNFDPRSGRLRSVGSERLPQDINALQLDREGVLWVGAVAGLFRLLPGEMELRAVDAVPGSELAHSSVLGLLVDSQQRLWIDTPLGLHRLRTAAEGFHFDRIALRGSALEDESQPLDGDFGANLQQDGEGRVWSQRYVFDPQRNSTYVLTRADGVDFGTGWYRSYASMLDGRLLFGGSEGVLVVDPQHFRPWTYEAPLRTTEWRVQGRVRAIGSGPEGFVLSPQDRSFALEFAALDFSLPEANRYRYRLLGFDQGWNQVDAGYRVASYSNLWPGEYWLEVQGSNRTGRLSGQMLRLPISIEPAWWQTPWTMLAAILLLLALGHAALRWRTRQIARQASKLRRLVDSQTGQLREAKQRAEQALTDLMATQQQLVQSEKLAALGQLVAGVAHEVNTPLGVALTAASHLQEATHASSRKFAEGSLRRSELEQWQRTSQESVQMILRSLERASELVKRFKQLAIDSRHENPVSMELADLARDLADTARVTLKQQSVEVALTVSGNGELITYPGALFQIMTQLAFNAALYAWPEGAETCSGSFSIECRLTETELLVRVADDGVGMSAETVARAFDPFFTTHRSRGAGLGLHMVHNLVCRTLRGSIELSSEPGKGACFELRLPRRVVHPSG